MSPAVHINQTLPPPPPPPPPPPQPPQMTLHPGLFRSGRLLFTRKPTAPSIPAPGQGCGYDETDEGRLTPQPPPSQDSTLGPAYYDVSHVSQEV